MDRFHDLQPRTDFDLRNKALPRSIRIGNRSAGFESAGAARISRDVNIRAIELTSFLAAEGVEGSVRSKAELSLGACWEKPTRKKDQKKEAEKGS